MGQQAIGRSALVLTTSYGKLVQGLDKSYAKVQSWKNQVQSLAGGGFAGRFFGKTGSDVLSTAIALADVGRQAKAIGANTVGFMGLDKQLQAVTGHAGMAGEVLTKLSAKIGLATVGGEAARPLAQLGLDAQKLAELRPDEQFLKIADALSNVENDSQRAGLGFKLFEDKYRDLAPVIAGGADAIRKKTEDLRASGQALGEADIAKLQRLKDSTKGAAGYFEGAWNKVVVALAPVLTTVGERIQSIFKAATPWIDVLIGGVQQFADLASGAFEAVVGYIQDALNETRDWLGEVYNTNDAATIVSGVVETIATRVLNVVSFFTTVKEELKFIGYSLQAYLLKGLDAVKESLADFIQGLAKVASFVGLDFSAEAKYWADGVRSAEFMAEAAEREAKARQASGAALEAFDSIGGQGNRDTVRNYMNRPRAKDSDYKSEVKVELPPPFANVLGAALTKGSKEEYSARVRLETGLTGANAIPMKQLTESQKQTKLLEKLANKPDEKLEITSQSI